MMAFLLFHPEPREALMIGLGGGSLAKFFLKKFKQTSIRVVELDPRVLAAAREHFALPPDGARLRVEVGDGAEAIARFRAERFDVVFTDLAMPRVSGWQVARAVKATRPQVPVVLVTGWGVEVQPDEMQTHGVDRVMTKPFRFEDVQEVVASFRGTGGLG